VSTWTAGTWADVAIGDNVLGGDGYAWRVTAGLINHFGIDGNGAGLRITMERAPVGARTGDIPAPKPVKYSAGEPRGIVVSCYACQRDEAPCENHATSKAPAAGERLPERMTSRLPKATEKSDCLPVRDTSEVLNDDSLCVEVDRKTTVGRSSDPSRSGTGMASGTAPFCLGCALDAHRCLGCAGPAKHGETACQACAPDGTDVPEAAPAAQTPRPDATSIPEVPRETSEIHCQPVAGGIACGPGGELTPDDRAAVEEFGEFLKVAQVSREVAEAAPAHAVTKPYVEWADDERAAATALKGAGIEVKVIERQMTLSELTSHLCDTHGVELPERGPLIGVEYRAVLADLHFDRHAHEQRAGEKWQARGRTPHVHPVMDRPMEDAVPRSWAKR
jgi:hypothetical protein